MTINIILDYFRLYGLYFLFLIVFLEYLNLPGLPAGIIMPAAGILIATSEMDFLQALVISIIAGILGSYMLYLIGYFVGKPLLDKFYVKYDQVRTGIDKITGFTTRHGNKGVLITRLIPVARTLISFSAGAFRMKLGPFTAYSILGITIWNSAYIYAGYAFGYLFLK